VPFRSEAEFVRWLGRRWPRRGPGLALGIGDDGAVVRARPGCDLVLTTDLSIEDVHFRLDLHPPRAIGHRALARVLSDLAAMGAKPRFALLSLALARRLTRSWITAFYDGFGALARRFGVRLIGGDTALVDGATVIDVIAVGEVKGRRALLRSGSRAGDRIYVTGRLGLAALGLDLLSNGLLEANRGARRAGENRKALGAHLYPEPRCAAGIELVRMRLASAAIDVTDGFAADLARLCAASGCGAVIREAQLPLPQAAPGRDSLELGLRGGEDYELILTVPAARAARMPQRIGGVTVREVGEIKAGRRLSLVRADGRQVALDTRGYDHFRKAGAGHHRTPW
jgi:thiamine-monophosphate kinase